MTFLVRFVVSLSIALLALGLGAGSAVAKEESCESARGQTMSPPVAKKLAAAQEMLKNDQLDGAQAELAAVLKRRGLRPLELANAFNLLAYVATEREKTPQAIAYFTRAIEQGALPCAQQYQLEYNVAQLHMMEGNFVEAIRILREWFKKAVREDSPVTPNGGNYYMLALAYMNLDPPLPDRARKPAEIAVSSSNDPAESWLQMLGQIYYMEKEYLLLAETLEELIERYNRPDYYAQLSGAYAEAGDEMKSLAVLQLAYRQDLLTKEGQFSQLAQLYLYHGLPYRAAQVLEKGIADGIMKADVNNLRLLADSWVGAREPENAFEPLGRAAEMSDKGDLYLRLAQAYISKQQWKDANDALGRALDGKKLKDKDRATVHLLRGLARMNLERWDSARASFRTASRFEDTKSSAEQYLKYMEARKRQLEALRS